MSMRVKILNSDSEIRRVGIRAQGCARKIRPPIGREGGLRHERGGDVSVWKDEMREEVAKTTS